LIRVAQADKKTLKSLVMSASHSRSFFVDLIKLLAAQLIVLHHFSAYGPLAQAIRETWPLLIDHLFSDARLAVQVFLVIGGYLAAQSLSARREIRPLKLIQQRYFRLMPSYVLALCWISALTWLLRPMISGDWLVPPPTLTAVLAHISLLQSVLDVPALSTGVWYVAIDFQLFALITLLAFALQTPRALSCAVAALCLASMLFFNRIDTLDVWAVYFFGAYGLGILAAWAKRSTADRWVFFLTLFFGIAAWLEHPRSRLALAMISALLLFAINHRQVIKSRLGTWVGLLADSSYAMFLTHFGVLIIASAIWEQFGLSGSTTALYLGATAWLLSNFVGWMFHHLAEKPLLAKVSPKKRSVQATSAA
jgi:peptidoglycan/LPS O-acetylase OafA/YrhL